MEVESFPEGKAFFDLVAVTEATCAEVTLERIPELGEKAPECQKQLGNVLSLLYREACCANGCPGNDFDIHFGQRIAGRVVNHALASYQLLCRGYYDECFALTRNLAETANLLFLFLCRPEFLPEWRKADEETLKREYSPVKVRLRLEELGIAVPINQTRYSELCEVGVHLGPSSSPQSHDSNVRPTLGSVILEPGLIAALNDC